jgi:hypothetical protein
MTFNPSIPNAALPPNLFPPQNSANFTQLQKIISADHQFNTTAQANDGFHLQCTMINRATPGSLPSGANGIFYSFTDAFGQSQLAWYNGNTNQVLTPYETTLPIRIVGVDSFTAGQQKTIFADPGYEYAGTAWGIVDGESSFAFLNVIRSGSNDSNLLDSHDETTSRPSILFSGNNLQMKNNSGSSKILRWSLIINRIN